MKNAILVLALVLALGTSAFTFATKAFANGAAVLTETSDQTSTPPGAKTGATNESYSELKADCLKETPALKGRELRKCVKAKKQASKSA